MAMDNNNNNIGYKKGDISNNIRVSQYNIYNFIF